MTDFEIKDKYGVYDLYKLVGVLRGENGCPWDKVQTHESIRNNFIEEVYEACEAIDEKSTEHLREELGDVLLQVMFHASIDEDAGHFDIDDAADECCKKLILRHPHVFGDVQVSGSDEVLVNWDNIKRVEKHQETVTDTLTLWQRACLPCGGRGSCKSGRPRSALTGRPLTALLRSWRMRYVSCVRPLPRATASWTSLATCCSPL